MNTHIQVATLEVEDGNVVRLERHLPVTDVHPHPVKQMVAVGFDNQLAVWSGNLTEQGSKGGLRARMQVYLRLLQQKQRRRVVTK